jgi:tRNA-specific 2-thiouridylase
MKRAVLAMSGGVDSSVAAWLLKEDGWEVQGVTFDFRLDGPPLEAARDAAEVCRVLEIPHRLLDRREQFVRRVVEPFRDDYFSGRTPNPCVRCNPLMKFSLLTEIADEAGATAIATGHYVNSGRVADWRRSHSAEAPGCADERFALWRAADARKDQSYVLFGLSQSQLARCLFPLGGRRKTEVRELAKQLGLHTHNRPDSQEICFIPDDDYGAFLERFAPERIRPGPLVDTAGRKIGWHEGVHRFTVGQRKGLGVALGSPRYVVRIEPETATVVIGEKEETFSGTFLVRDVNWVAVGPPGEPFAAKAKIRYTHTPKASRIIPLEDGRSVRVEFDEPESAVTPGQAAVFYRDDLVLGGGLISETVA